MKNWFKTKLEIILTTRGAITCGGAFFVGLLIGKLILLMTN